MPFALAGADHVILIEIGPGAVSVTMRSLTSGALGTEETGIKTQFNHCYAVSITQLHVYMYTHCH